MEATLAIFVEVGGATFDNAEKHGLVVGSVASNELLSLLWG